MGEGIVGSIEADLGEFPKLAEFSDLKNESCHELSPYDDLSSDG